MTTEALTSKPATPGAVPGQAKPSDQPKQAQNSQPKAQDKPAQPKRRATAARRNAQRTTPKVAQEVIRVVRSVEDADDDTRILAATLFNIEPEVDDIAVAIATADKDIVGVVSSLIDLRDTEETLDAMVKISSWDAKKTTAPAWRFLHALDLVSRQMPRNDTETAAEFVKVLSDIPAEIDNLLELLS